MPLQKIPKKGIVPHIFPWDKPKAKCVGDRINRGRKRTRLALEAEVDQMAWEDVGAMEEVTTDQVADDTERRHCSSQTPCIVMTDEVVQCNLNTPSFSLSELRNDPAGVHLFTGLETYNRLTFILSTLGPAAEYLIYYQGSKPPMSIEDQFFLTLIKLRLHRTNLELSRMFKISKSMVMNVFITWVNFMYVSWSEINWWTSRDLVNYYAPTDFKAKFPKTRVIVDGTECPILKPRQPLLQRTTFSTYKNRNTVKVLVGCSPGGQVTFCSDAYGGSTSDRQIVERSSLINICDSGDSIMADKGFNVQDLFVPANVTINIPTFFKKTNRLTGKVVMRDRKIASKRVHVERIIGLAKTFKILREPMSNTESNLATEIITVCFYLCNFRSGIVPKDA